MLDLEGNRIDVHLLRLSCGMENLTLSDCLLAESIMTASTISLPIKATKSVVAASPSFALISRFRAILLRPLVAHH
jgi:hypothetical protein